MDDEDDTQQDPSFIGPVERGVPKRDFINEEIVQILDSCKISNPCAMRLMVALLQSLSFDVNKFVLSASTLHRRRNKHRRELFFKMKEEFVVSPY